MIISDFITASYRADGESLLVWAPKTGEKKTVPAT
jgi:hypothetical protein